MYQAEIKGAFTPVPVSVAGGARGAEGRSGESAGREPQERAGGMVKVPAEARNT